MAHRPLTLHTSALTDSEYAQYTSVLQELLDSPGPLTQAEIDTARVSVREARAWIRGRYALGEVDEILRFFSPTLSATDTISSGELFAALRMVVHAEQGRGVERGLAFVHAFPTKIPATRPPPPPPPSAAAAATHSHSHPHPQEPNHTPSLSHPQQLPQHPQHPQRSTEISPAVSAALKEKYPRPRNLFDRDLHHVGVVGSFNGAGNFAVHGNVLTTGRDNITINHDTSSSDDMKLLDRLAASACIDAGHEIVLDVDRPKCHEDTRHAVINDIVSWVNSRNPSEKILWLKGPAGAGKSSVVQSVCIDCRKEDKLLSSFFFSRAVGGPREDGNRLVATIAYQTMQTIPETAQHILKVLATDPAILSCTSAALHVLQKLVLNPLAIVASQRESLMPYVLVVDGLDEVNDKKLQEKIIRLFAEAVASTDLNIKVLIASRPEVEIRTTFDNPSIRQLTTEIVLDNKYKPVIKRSHTISAILFNWPAPDDVKELVRRSSGQFIYAATVIKYISDKRHDPVKRLCQIISIQSGSDNSYSDLDELYSHILKTASENAHGFQHLLPLFQVLLFIPSGYFPSDDEMANILDITINILLIKLADLHSLIHVSSVARDLYIWHRSLMDYLEDSSRSGQFFISEKLANKYLARRCLPMILNNASEEIDSEEPFTKRYSRQFYLIHLAESGFDEELVDELLMLNKNIVGLITDQIFMQMMVLEQVGDAEVDRESIIKHYFSQADNTFKPVNEKLLSLCELISAKLDILALGNFQLDETIHAWKIFRLAGACGETYETTPMSLKDIWLRSMLCDPDRGQQFYLDSQCCQHVWLRLWNAFRSPDEQTKNIPRNCPQEGMPTVFKFLLKRIEPCRKFSRYLCEFKDKFKHWYFDNCKPGECNEWIPFKEEMDLYIEECESLNMDNFDSDTDFNEDKESISLIDGVVIQSPWIIVDRYPDDEDDEDVPQKYITYSSEMQGDIHELLKHVSRIMEQKEHATQNSIPYERQTECAAEHSQGHSEAGSKFIQHDGRSPEYITDVISSPQFHGYIEESSDSMQYYQLEPRTEWSSGVGEHIRNDHAIEGGRNSQLRLPPAARLIESSAIEQGYSSYQITQNNAIIAQEQWSNYGIQYAQGVSGNLSINQSIESSVQRQSWYHDERSGMNCGEMLQFNTAMFGDSGRYTHTNGYLNGTSYQEIHSSNIFEPALVYMPIINNSLPSSPQQWTNPNKAYAYDYSGGGVVQSYGGTYATGRQEGIAYQHHPGNSADTYETDYDGTQAYNDPEFYSVYTQNQSYDYDTTQAHSDPLIYSVHTHNMQGVNSPTMYNF